MRCRCSPRESIAGGHGRWRGRLLGTLALLAGGGGGAPGARPPPPPPRGRGAGAQPGPAGGGGGVDAASQWSETQAAPVETRLARLALDLVVGADPEIAQRMRIHERAWRTAHKELGEQAYGTLLAESRYLAARTESSAALVQVCDRVLRELDSIEGEQGGGGPGAADVLLQEAEVEVVRGAARRSLPAAACAIDSASCVGVDPQDQALLEDIERGMAALDSADTNADLSPASLRRRARLYRLRALLDQRVLQARARQVLGAVREAVDRERPAGSRMRSLRAHPERTRPRRVVPTDPYGAGS